MRTFPSVEWDEKTDNVIYFALHMFDNERNSSCLSFESSLVWSLIFAADFLSLTYIVPVVIV